MKQFKSFCLLSFVLVAAAILVSCCGIEPVSPAQGSEVVLHTPIQQKFLQMPREERRAYFADKACRKELISEGFYPQPVVLSWKTCKDCQKEFTVTLSTSPDFAEGTCTTYTTKEKQLEVTNLMIATTYYWKVQCEKKCSRVSSFVTEDVAPRLLKIRKVGNCRDLGGRIGLNGRRVKQNMVLRTAGLNQNAQAVYYTPEELQQNPQFLEKVKELNATTQLLKDAVKEEVPFLLNGEWTVFLPEMESFGDEELAQVDALTEIPETFLGAKGVKMTADKDGAITPGKFIASLPSVLMMDFVSPKTGIMPFACGADWYWYLRLNGITYYDRRGGNDKLSAKDNYMLFLPVKEGHNLVTVYLGSGSGGFTWYCGPVPQGMPLETVVESGIQENEGILVRASTKQGKRDENGKQIYTKGESNLNQEGLDFLQNTIGLKTEIDLRGEKETACMTGSPAGDNVNWFNFSSSSYAGMQGDWGREQFTKTFRIFLDEKNYPIDFHCIAGQDRTGSVAFILNALLGVCEEELYLDWESTGFWNKSKDFRHEPLFDKLVAGFQKWPGNTINEKVENYILSLGFTQEDIQHFRDIMLEK